MAQTIETVPTRTSTAYHTGASVPSSLAGAAPRLSDIEELPGRRSLASEGLRLRFRPMEIRG